MGTTENLAELMEGKATPEALRQADALSEGFRRGSCFWPESVFPNPVGKAPVWWAAVTGEDPSGWACWAAGGGLRNNAWDYYGVLRELMCWEAGGMEMAPERLAAVATLAPGGADRVSSGVERAVSEGRMRAVDAGVFLAGIEAATPGGEGGCLPKTGRLSRADTVAWVKAAAGVLGSDWADNVLHGICEAPREGDGGVTGTGFDNSLRDLPRETLEWVAAGLLEGGADPGRGDAGGDRPLRKLAMAWKGKTECPKGVTELFDLLATTAPGLDGLKRREPPGGEAANTPFAARVLALAERDAVEGASAKAVAPGKKRSM